MGEKIVAKDLERILYTVEEGFDSLLRPYTNIYAYIIVLSEERYLNLIERATATGQKQHREGVEEALDFFDDDPHGTPKYWGGGHAFAIYTGKTTVQGLEKLGIEVERVQPERTFTSQRVCDDVLHDEVEDYLNLIGSLDKTRCYLVTYYDMVTEDANTDLHECNPGNVLTYVPSAYDAMKSEERKAHVRNVLVHNMLCAVVNQEPSEIKKAQKTIAEFVSETPIEEIMKIFSLAVQKYDSKLPAFPKFVQTYMQLVDATIDGDHRKQGKYLTAVSNLIGILDTA